MSSYRSSASSNILGMFTIIFVVATLVTKSLVAWPLLVIGLGVKAAARAGGWWWYSERGLKVDNNIDKMTHEAGSNSGQTHSDVHEILKAKSPKPLSLPRPPADRKQVQALSCEWRQPPKKTTAPDSPISSSPESSPDSKSSSGLTRRWSCF